MNITLHNTLSGKKEIFTPADPNNVTMYVCGPTVYNRIHIGNARPAVVFDVFVRLLRAVYPKLTYARNITDVDDKINKAAADEGVEISVIANKFAQAYQEDMAALLNTEPDVQPKATEHIPEMVDTINTLIQRGHAYESEGHVLFHVPSMSDYGKLSNRKLDDMIAGARVEVADYKKHPMDFVLWKPSEDGLPGWESPWSYGRPGWHIECTAMINKHLGKTIDIHGGGSDLVFPHHENERAQGMCSCDDEGEYARYWMHNGMININGEKMSKSLGNFITVAELLEQYPGEQLRYALMSAQYRSTLNFTDDLLKQAKVALDRFYTALRELADVTPVAVEDITSLEVTQALADDMNTPVAIAALHELSSKIFKTEDQNEKAVLKGQMLACGELLGLLQQDPEQWFKAGNADEITAEAIEALIEDRKTAKKDKDFARADAIRQELLDAGVEIQDTREGTRWQRV